MSGLTMQKSDPSGLLIFEKLKYKAVSSSTVIYMMFLSFLSSTTPRVLCVTNTKPRKAKASPTPSLVYTNFTPLCLGDTKLTPT